MDKGAIISEDTKYRYSLHRIWDANLPKVAFIGLNPSTADKDIDDPTIKRCIEFVKNWGYGGFYMLNLFAYRATDPNELTKTEDPIGINNTKTILETISKVEKVICAWGNEGILMNQNKTILSLIPKPYCLKINTTGEPAHPLYLSGTLEPIEYYNKTEMQEKNTELLKKSKHIFIQRNYPKDKLYDHIQKHLLEDKETITKVTITDAEVIFKSEDEIYIGDKNIFWYSSRVGKYYTKSNGDLDAEHESDEYKIKTEDIYAWKTVNFGNQIFLELQEYQGKYYRTVEITETEIENLMKLQKELNEITNASR